MDSLSLRRFGRSILFGHGLAVEKHFYDNAVTRPLGVTKHGGQSPIRRFYGNWASPKNAEQLLRLLSSGLGTFWIN
jgi:hypothetical protein